MLHFYILHSEKLESLLVNESALLMVKLFSN